jgi:PGF-pre-PGF domain-containing protein
MLGKKLGFCVALAFFALAIAFLSVPAAAQGISIATTSTGIVATVDTTAQVASTVNVPAEKVYTTKITQVEITPAATMSQVQVAISALSGLPVSVASPPTQGPVYQYVEITSNVAPGLFSSAKVRFRVENSNIPAGHAAKLARYTQGWDVLSTVQTSQDATYSYFEAATQGFSVFAVLLIPIPSPSPTPTPCTDSDGGKDYYVKGTTIGVWKASGNVETRTDECDPQLYDGRGLAESWCEDDYIWSMTYDCPNGCKDGACISLAPIPTPTPTPGVTPTPGCPLVSSPSPDVKTKCYAGGGVFKEKYENNCIVGYVCVYPAPTPTPIACPEVPPAPPSEKGCKYVPAYDERGCFKGYIERCPVTGSEFKIELQKGWNMFSVPIACAALVVEAQPTKISTAASRPSAATAMVIAPAVTSTSAAVASVPVATSASVAAGYRKASWVCYDGYAGSLGSAEATAEAVASSCRLFDSWRKEAEVNCAGRCSKETGKCGVNSFSVSGECVATVVSTGEASRSLCYVDASASTCSEFMKGSMVWRYDPVTGRYVPEKIYPNGLLASNVGYWIKAAQQCVVVMRGSPVSFSERLFKGWNLIGAGSKAISWSEALGNCKARSGPWYWSTSDGKYVKPVLMEPGKAYWVKVAEDCQAHEVKPRPAMSCGEVCKAKGYTGIICSSLVDKCGEQLDVGETSDCSSEESGAAKTCCCIKLPPVATPVPSHTCAEICKAKGYASARCGSAPVIPNAVACKEGEVGVGATSDCATLPNTVGAFTTCCCSKTPQACPAVCVPMWSVKENECVFMECGSGCGADGISTFKTEEECKARLVRQCVQSGTACCIGDSCSDMRIDCVSGYKPGFYGCTPYSCQPQWKCVPIATPTPYANVTPGCPLVSSPSPDAKDQCYSSGGVFKEKRDDNGCLVGYMCVYPTPTPYANETPQ